MACNIGLFLWSHQNVDQSDYNPCKSKHCGEYIIQSKAPGKEEYNKHVKKQQHKHCAYDPPACKLVSINQKHRECKEKHESKKQSKLEYKCSSLQAKHYEYEADDCKQKYEQHYKNTYWLFHCTYRFAALFIGAMKKPVSFFVMLFILLFTV